MRLLYILDFKLFAFKKNSYVNTPVLVLQVISSHLRIIYL